VLDAQAIGYPVTAFLTLEIRQGAGHEAIAQHLAAIPEVLEAYTITGAGDMWARVVARSNADLQRVIDAVLSDPGIVRSTTVIALAEQIRHRVLPLLEESVTAG
jgi:DNA-binding Lrp family transcriptional regulator